MATLVKCPICGQPKRAQSSRFIHCNFRHNTEACKIVPGSAPAQPVTPAPVTPPKKVKKVAKPVQAAQLEVTPHIEPTPAPTPAPVAAPAPPPAPVEEKEYGCECGAEFDDPLPICPNCGGVLTWS